MRTKLGRGEDGKSGVPKLDLTQTSSWTPSQQTNESGCSAHSPWLFVKDDFRRNFMEYWLRAQSEVPSHTWHRPSGRTIGQTPPKTRMESLVDFYQDYSDLSKTKIQKENNKKPYQRLSFAHLQKCASQNPKSQ